MSLNSFKGILLFTSLTLLCGHALEAAPHYSTSSSSHSLLSHAKTSTSVVTTSERALIAIVNLSIVAKKHKNLYQREEKRAIKKILKNLGSLYGKILIYSDQDTTRVNFLKAIARFENDPSIRAIDAIVYIHGKEDTLGFVDTPEYYPSAKLKDDILALKNIHGESPKKLRALYSDACFGAFHMRDWVAAGFKVTAGAAGVDANWSMDLKKFMKGWRKGETFARSMKRANRVIISPLMDLAIRGKSYKYVLGDTLVQIDTPVE